MERAAQRNLGAVIGRPQTIIMIGPERRVVQTLLIVGRKAGAPASVLKFSAFRSAVSCPLRIG